MPDFGSFRGFGDKLVQGQTPTQLGKIGSDAFGFDVDAIAFFTRVANAGGSLSDNEQNAVDVLVKQMKADGTWTPMKAMYPMVGASAAACAQNLKSSSFTGTFFGGWTFASTGVTPSNGYMKTSFIPSTELTNSEGHMSVYNRTDGASGFEMGAQSGSTWFLFASKFTNALSYIAMGAGYDNGTATTSQQGLFIATQSVANSKKAYRNGVEYLSFAYRANSPNIEVYLGGINDNGSLSLPTSRSMAFFSMGNALTPSETIAMSTAVQAFQRTLGRQV
jgi:hypothetical protein